MNLSVENYMVSGETMFHCISIHCQGERRGAIAIAHHHYEEHNSPINRDEKFRLKNF